MGSYRSSCKSSCKFVRNSVTPQAAKLYLSSSDVKMQYLAMILIAQTADDAQTCHMAADFAQTAVQVLTDVLKDSSESLAGELSAAEIADGMRLLMVSDANKSAFVNAGVLSVLEEMLSNSPLEQNKMAAVQCLWTLAFGSAERLEILRKPSMMSRLYELKDKAASTELREKAADAVAFIAREGKPRGAQKPSNDSEKRSIFISYCHKQKQVVMRILESLQAANFDCWIDVEDMNGSTLEAMALGIERCHLALVCYSEEYRNSNNCRAEAEYIFQMRKPIVPIKMQDNFKPDGWLGIILGSRFYIDFSLTSVPCSEALRKLVGEMQTQIDIDADSRNKETTKQACKQPIYSAWSNDDVRKWLQDHSLSWQALEKIDGESLATLHHIRTTAPEVYYTVLVQSLQSSDLASLLQHLAALERLFANSQQK